MQRLQDCRVLHRRLSKAALEAAQNDLQSAAGRGGRGDQKGRGCRGCREHSIHLLGAGDHSGQAPHAADQRQAPLEYVSLYLLSAAVLCFNSALLQFCSALLCPALLLGVLHLCSVLLCYRNSAFFFALLLHSIILTLFCSALLCSALLIHLVSFFSPFSFYPHLILLSFLSHSSLLSSNAHHFLCAQRILLDRSLRVFDLCFDNDSAGLLAFLSQPTHVRDVDLQNEMGFTPTYIATQVRVRVRVRVVV